MTKRRNFRASVAVQIRKRATDAQGVMRCEECGVAVKRGEVHHLTPDGLEIDKGRPLTASDGVLLCGGPGSCHGRHTASDVPAIAKAKRREAAHLGETKIVRQKLLSRGFPKRERPRAIMLKAVPRRDIFKEG